MNIYIYSYNMYMYVYIYIYTYIHIPPDFPTRGSQKPRERTLSSHRGCHCIAGALCEETHGTQKLTETRK